MLRKVILPFSTNETSGALTPVLGLQHREDMDIVKGNPSKRRLRRDLIYVYKYATWGSGQEYLQAVLLCKHTLKCTSRTTI